MKRRLFNLLSAGSLVLCVLVLAGWARSHRYPPDSLIFTTASRALEIRFVVTGWDGCLLVGRMESEEHRLPHGFSRSDFEYGEMFRFDMLVNKPETWWRRWGFGHETFRGNPEFPWEHGYATLMMPFWAVMPLVAMPLPPWAVSLWRRHRQRSRRKLGLCVQCGYDLRAHAPGDKCPECGHPVPADLVRKPMEQG